MSLEITKIVKGIFWFSDSTQYSEYKAILVDPESLPGNFNEWQQETADVIHTLENQGITVTKVCIEVENFIEWCKLDGRNINTMACKIFANRKAFRDFSINDSGD